MEKKIENRIELYSEIYLKAFEKALKVNPNNARYIASEIFKEVARDLRSELISKLQRENGKGAEIKREETEETEEKNGANNNGGSLKENNDESATDKQIYALHKFGLKNLPEYLTKKSASEVLGILVHHSKEGDNEAIVSIVGKFNKEWADVNGNNSSLK